MKKNNLNLVRQYGFYLVVGGVFLLESIVLASFFPQQITKLVTNWQSLSESNRQVTVFKDVSAALTAQNKNSVGPYLARARSTLPDEKKTAGLISGLTKFAGNYGVAVKTFDFSPGLISTASASTGFLQTNTSGEVIIAGGVKAIPATLTVTADPTSLKSFFDALLKASQLVSVTLVDYLNNTANISILIYYQPVDTKTIDWQNIKTLTKEDILFVGTLATEDQFILK